MRWQPRRLRKPRFFGFLVPEERYVMLRKTLAFVSMLVVCCVLCVLVGCTAQPPAPPPQSDAITTEPLDIEIPTGEPEGTAEETDTDPAPAEEEAADAPAEEEAEPAPAEAETEPAPAEEKPAGDAPAEKPAE
jgi:hypothetical protein